MELESDGDTDADAVTDGVTLELVVAVTDIVGVADGDGERDTVVETVTDAVGDGDADIHSPEPMVLVVPEGHNDWEEDVDPGAQ